MTRVCLATDAADAPDPTCTPQHPRNWMQTPGFRRNCAATALLVHRSQCVAYDGGASATLPVVRTGAAGAGMVRAVDALGSAILTAHDHILTAWHLVEMFDPADLVVCFGYDTVPTSGTVTLRACGLAASIDSGDDSDDWAVLRLQRRLELSVPSRQAHIRQGKTLYMLGHPLGAPRHISYDATRGPTHRTAWFTTLWAKAGSSGGPVFDATTHSLIGTLEGGSPTPPLGCRMHTTRVIKLPSMVTV